MADFKPSEGMRRLGHVGGGASVVAYVWWLLASVERWPRDVEEWGYFALVLGIPGTLAWPVGWWLTTRAEWLLKWVRAGFEADKS